MVVVLRGVELTLDLRIHLVELGELVLHLGIMAQFGGLGIHLGRSIRVNR